MDNKYESAFEVNKVLPHILYCYFVTAFSNGFLFHLWGGNSFLKHSFNKPSRGSECAPSDQQVALSRLGALQWRGLAPPPRRRPVASPVGPRAVVSGGRRNVAASVPASLPGSTDRELLGEGFWP